MNKKFLESLKTKAKSFGFNDKEVENVGAILSKLNPNLAKDDCPDEEINSFTEAGISMMQQAQSHSDSVLRISSDNHKKEVENLNAKIKELESGKSKTEPKPSATEIPAEILQRIDALEKQNTELSQKVLNSQTEVLAKVRETKFKETLKDADADWFKSVEKQFSRMTFKDDADFDAYLEEVAKDSLEFNQAKANTKLHPFTVVKNGTNSKDGIRPIVNDVMHQRLQAKGIEVTNGGASE